ncbi:hypothetical protein HYU96_00915 [Candidatus Daviesbacteria bacterium]|nr:hypothetical protein [Candidatus Daviesbacteria bacterium]
MAIVTAILVLVVIAGYLVWLRSRYQPPVSPQVGGEIQVTPSPEPAVSASPSATPGKEATGSVKQKTSSPGAAAR